MLRFPKRKTTRISIHLTALIDMIFLLLIYFLLTSSFAEKEGIPVSVPEVTTAALYSERIVTVVIDRDGGFYMDGRSVKDKDLGVLLRTHLALSADKGVVIKADKRVVYDRVVQALDIAKANGAQRLHLTVETRLTPAGRP